MAGGNCRHEKVGRLPASPDFLLDFSGRVGRYFSYSQELLAAPRIMGERFTASSAGWF
jgi:hypothetical protein